MDRRTFLKAASVPLGASALGLEASALAAAVQTSPRSSVVVVGGGAFGAWTALHLREMGHTVTLLDAYGPGNSRATSGDAFCAMSIRARWPKRTPRWRR